MKKQVKCWEFFKCDEERCPAYQAKDLRCWLIPGTHCRKDTQGTSLEKMEMCLQCELLKANMDVDSVEETLKAVNEQFAEFREIVEARDRELAGTSMELALGLSEVFEALREISLGDPSVRIPETSQLELMTKLKHMVNLAAQNLGEIVDLSHEFAIGLAEHFGVLHRVSTGDLAARVSGTSDVELLESLKKVTNQMIESVSKEIADRKRAEQALVKSERLAAIGQTTAGLAECIKGILFGLEGGVYIVNKALRRNDMRKLNDGWDVVRGNIDKVSNLVLDLLTYSKEREPKYEICSPNVIAEEVCELTEPEAKGPGVQRIEIVRDFDPNIGEVSLDPKGIHRCLLNLVSNAIHACMSEQSEGKEYLVKVTTRRESEGAVSLRVSDNGCGMDKAVKTQLFASFFSTKGTRGTGLGLLVTQKIVQEHGGTLSVDSEPGKGSTFIILLPRKNQGD